MAVALLVAACQWGHVGFSPARTRFHPFENTIGADNVDQLIERWSVPLAAPVGAGGRVYVNAGRDERTAFHALDATLLDTIPRFSAALVDDVERLAGELGLAVEPAPR